MLFALGRCVYARVADLLQGRPQPDKSARVCTYLYRDITLSATAHINNSPVALYGLFDSIYYSFFIPTLVKVDVQRITWNIGIS